MRSREKKLKTPERAPVLIHLYSSKRCGAWWWYGLGLALSSLALLLLSACVAAGRPLLSEVSATPSTLHPTGEGETIAITYLVGCEAHLSIVLEDADGHRYELRRDKLRWPSSDPYTMQFDGTVPTDDPTVQRRLLPSGEYAVVVQAQSEQCGSAESRVPVTIEGSNVDLPRIENLLVWPKTISPNADAVDDVAEITYRLPVTATVDIHIATPAGDSFPIVSREEEMPAEQYHVWDGKRPDGSFLSNGLYTCTITAEDTYGNLVQRQQQIQLEEVGDPQATIIYARIAPKRVMLGETITVTMRVKNSGPVPIRTYGPPSGYTYTTNEVFSSVQGGRYASHAGGFWRVGVDWDANSGDGPKRYPFRWALSPRPPDEWKIPDKEDWLMPGEEVEIIGNIVVLQRETKMGFYVGLIQDGVGFYQNRTARTIVEVGF